MGILAPKNYGLLRNCDALRVQLEGILRLADLGVTPLCYVPDEDWIIEDPATCTIEGGVITWNRVSGDSFIRLANFPGLADGDIYAFTYEVVDDSGQGDADSRLFIDANSYIRPAAQVGTLIGPYSFRIAAETKVYMLRWTPTSAFNGHELKIRNVAIYKLNVVPPLVPDSAWIREDPATCSIENGVITWNRVSADSFIRIAIPAHFVPGQAWALSYDVLDNSGVGGLELYCSNASSVETGRTVNTDLGAQYSDRVTTDQANLLRFTPRTPYNNKTLQITNVRLYNIGDPLTPIPG